MNKNDGFYSTPGDLTKKFYTYEGCVTGPPFPECVRWIVFDQSLQVSREHFESLRNVFSVERSRSGEECFHDIFMRGDDCVVKEPPKIGENFIETPYKLNGRVVEKSF